MFQSDLHSVMLLTRQRQADLREAAAPGRVSRPDRMVHGAPSAAAAPAMAATAPIMRAWLQAVSGGRRAPEAA
jgi:hypothetical protein